MKMILTGKAKLNFLAYYGTGENYFLTTINEIEQHANIIEWLDSVGIFIGVNPYFENMLGYNRGFEPSIYQDGEKPITIYQENDVFEKRIEATKAAILKANEIYNKR